MGSLFLLLRYPLDPLYLRVGCAELVRVTSRPASRLGTGLTFGFGSWFDLIGGQGTVNHPCCLGNINQECLADGPAYEGW